MTDKWHLTPDSGAVKGNNPFQLNRTTIDSSFRSPTTSYNVSDINGYSATGEIIFKNENRSVSLAPPREKHCLDQFKRPVVGRLSAANAGNNVAIYNDKEQCGGSQSKVDQLTQALGAKARTEPKLKARSPSALSALTDNMYAKILSEKRF